MTPATAVARRWFLRDCGLGLGSIALHALLAQDGRAEPGRSPDPLAPRKPHFTPKAKRVIHLFMAGAPSQLDLFDYKPDLTKFEGKPIPPSVIGGQRYAATWTGDNKSDWDHLAWSIPMALNMGLSGQPFVGPDIGGFVGDADAKLFARWMGIGALLPSLTRLMGPGVYAFPRFESYARSVATNTTPMGA